LYCLGELIEEDPLPAAKKRRLTPKQAQKNFEEEENALKKAMAITLPHKYVHIG
jgi:Na+-transporting methylmalonyl-CoA/oxaloacetate decarboxylase gamma subunit